MVQRCAFAQGCCAHLRSPRRCCRPARRRTTSAGTWRARAGSSALRGRTARPHRSWTCSMRRARPAARGAVASRRACAPAARPALPTAHRHPSVASPLYHPPPRNHLLGASWPLPDMPRAGGPELPHRTLENWRLLCAAAAAASTGRPGPPWAPAGSLGDTWRLLYYTWCCVSLFPATFCGPASLPLHRRRGSPPKLVRLLAGSAPAQRPQALPAYFWQLRGPRGHPTVAAARGPPCPGGVPAPSPPQKCMPCRMEAYLDRRDSFCIGHMRRVSALVAPQDAPP